MNGKQGRLLVAGDYGASDEDSDSEDLQLMKKEKKLNTLNHSVIDGNGLSVNYEMQGWSVLYDQVSGYPYYWNPQTNEVRWDKPLELEDAKSTPTKKLEESDGETDFSKHGFNKNSSATSSPNSTSRQLDEHFIRTKLNKISKSKFSKNSKANGNESLVFIGPSLPPEPNPENLALQKVRHFEENLASTLISEIDDESPPDWNSPLSSTISNSACTKEKTNSLHGSRPMYAKPFSWKTTEPIIPMINEIEDQVFVTKSPDLKTPSHPIAIIAHGYGEEDSENDDIGHTLSKEDLMKDDIGYSKNLESQCDVFEGASRENSSIF
jgi:hypothetical protein